MILLWENHISYYECKRFFITRLADFRSIYNPIFDPKNIINKDRIRKSIITEANIRHILQQQFIFRYIATNFR